MNQKMLLLVASFSCAAEFIAKPWCCTGCLFNLVSTNTVQMPYIVSGAWTVDKSTAENSPRNCSVYFQVRTSRVSLLILAEARIPRSSCLGQRVSLPSTSPLNLMWPGFHFAMECKQKNKNTQTYSLILMLLSKVQQTPLCQSKLKALICQTAAWKNPFAGCSKLLWGVQMLFVRPDKALNPQHRQRRQSLRAQTSAQLADTRTQ